MKLDLPDRRVRKGKLVFIAHAARKPEFHVFISSAYWGPYKSWGRHNFFKLPAALRYARRLVDALGNGQEVVEFVGSMTYHKANLRTGEIT